MGIILETRRVLLLTGLVAAIPAVGFSQVMVARSAALDGGPGGATAIPRNPYAGAWEGTMSRRGGSADATPMAMSFSVVDGAVQTYSGETTIDGGAPSAHLNFDAAPVGVVALAAVPSGGGTMARRTGSGDGAAAAVGGGVVAVRRSAAGGPSATSGPSDGSGLSQLQMSDNSALFVYSAQRTPLFCDSSHRCADMPVLRWEEKDATGETLVYSAQLVAPDNITGTVRRHGDAGDEAVGTFTLRRQQ